MAKCEFYSMRNGSDCKHTDCMQFLWETELRAAGLSGEQASYTTVEFTV